MNWKVAGAIAALAVAATGCAGLNDLEAEGQGPAERQERVGPAATVDAGKTIAKATFDSPAASGAKIEIGVVELRVSGRLANLTLAITPRVPGEESPNVYELNGNSDPNVSLVDTVNLKRYVVVKDSAGRQLQPDYISVHLRNEQPNIQTYTFAAPPEGVRAVDVSFGQWPPFRDVPVTR